MGKLLAAALAALFIMAAAASAQTATNTPTRTPTPTKTPNLCSVPNCDSTPGTPCSTPVAANIDAKAAASFGDKQIHMRPVGTPGAVKMQWGCRPSEAGEIVWFEPTPQAAAFVTQTTLACHSFWCRIQECSSGSCRVDGYGRGFGVD